MTTLRPSSAARRMACPGSFKLEQFYPQPQSPSASEGEAAHWLAEAMLRDYGYPNKDIIADIKEAPNGEIITEDMRRGAKLYRDTIVSRMPINLISIEQKLYISIIHPDCSGTPDAFGYYEKTIYIWDYKYGHKSIDVFENWQLLEYACGAYSMVSGGYTHIELIIVQPRDFSSPEGQVRSWRFPVSDLIDKYLPMLQESERCATSEDPPCTPSPECSYCSARAHCPALRAAALTTVDLANEAIPLELSPESLGYELAYLHRGQQLLDARISGLEVEALTHLTNGKSVPNYKIDYTKPRDKWALDAKQLEDLGKLYGITMVNKEPITPKQAVDLGMPKDVVDKHRITPSGAKKLAPFTAKDAAKMFGGNK